MSPRTAWPGPRAGLALGLFLAAAASACGGAGGLDGNVYRGPDVTYKLGHLGEGWRPIEVEGQNDAAWMRSDLASVVQVNASCDPSLDIPLEALTNHLLIGFTEREIEKQERVPMAAREALRTEVRAKLDGVPRRLVLLILKKDGCVYDFALIAPPDERFPKAESEYTTFLAGFETGGSRP